ncbi:MAG: flippase [Actinobacteria bacterium]|nr:flippase [Actinomycetota bacterium]
MPSLNQVRESRMALSISGTALLQAAAMGMAFVTSLILSHSLGAAGLGAYAYGMAWVGFLLIPAVMGMDRFLVRGVATYETNRDWSHLRGLVSWANRSVLTLSTALAVVAAAIGYLTLKPAFRTTFCLAMPLLPVTALVITRQSTMIGLSRSVAGQFPEYVLRPLLFIFALLPFVAGTALKLTPGLAMTLNVGSVIIAFGVGGVLLRRSLPAGTRTAEPAHERRAWRRAALPMMLLGGMWLINPLISTIMLGSLRGARDVGVYTVVARAADVLTIGLLAVTTPLSPRIAQLFTLGDSAGLQSVVTKAARLSVAWSAPVAVVLIVFSHPLLGIFGSQFAGAGGPLAIMVVGQFVNTGAGPTGVVLMMTKHERAAAVAVAAGVLVNIALNALLVPSLGVVGAALGTAASRIIWNVSLAAYAGLRLHINTTAVTGRRSGPTGPAAPEPIAAVTPATFRSET